MLQWCPEGTRTPTVCRRKDLNQCVYQFRHPGDATHNFTFTPDTCQKNRQNHAKRRAASLQVAARNRRRAKRLSPQQRLHAGRGPIASRRAAATLAAARAGDIDPALLPSREAILAALRNAGTPLPPADLERELSVGQVARDAFDGRLAAMERDGQLLTNRKGELCVVAKLDLVVGIVQGHPDGFGFLVPEDGGDDFFLSPREMHKVLHGDRAASRMSASTGAAGPKARSSRCSRAPIARSSDGCTRSAASWFIVAENRRINQDFLVPADALGGAKRRRSRRRRDRRAARRRIAKRSRASKEVLGNATDPGIEIEIALRKHALPFEFSQGRGAAGEAASRPKCARRTARAASTSRRCRSSPSTARPRRISTTPSTASARARASG